MKIRIVQPHTHYPFAWIHADIRKDGDCYSIAEALSDNRITILGPWEADMVENVFVGVKAPALLGRKSG